MSANGSGFDGAPNEAAEARMVLASSAKPTGESATA
jgi:hypothetical protein